AMSETQEKLVIEKNCRFFMIISWFFINQCIWSGLKWSGNLFTPLTLFQFSRIGNCAAISNNRYLIILRFLFLFNRMLIYWHIFWVKFRKLKIMLLCLPLPQT